MLISESEKIRLKNLTWHISNSCFILLFFSLSGAPTLKPPRGVGEKKH
jgi:hypothetical protein